MKRIDHLIAFAALLVPMFLSADTTNIAFNTALTNATEWTYSGDVRISADSDKHVFLNTLKSYVQSPEYPFSITSIEITLSCSSTNATRWLQVKTSAGTSRKTANVTSKDRKEIQSFLFDGADCIRSFNISLEGSGQTGNWHIYSAIVSGVAIVEAPTGLKADDVKGTRCRLSWTNPANAVSNRIDVSRVERREERGEVVEDFGFDEISAGGNARDFFAFELPPLYDRLSGCGLYAAANSTGLLQISTGKKRGELVHAGFDSYDGLALLLTLRRYPGDANTMAIAWSDGNATNDFATVPLADDFTAECVALSNVTAGAKLILNSSGNDDNHRVIVDRMAFVRDYAPETEATNLVKAVFATDGAKTLRGLSPNSTYIVRITAFDAEGNESAPSEPMTFTTNGRDLPFAIKLR